MHLIAIAGKPGSEKFVYAFKIIQELRFHGQTTEVVSLAAPLYSEFNAMADFVRAGGDAQTLKTQWNLGPQGDELHSILSEDLGVREHYGYSRRLEPVRKGLTLLGSGIRRKQDPNYFMAKLLLEAERSSTTFGVLTDLRYPNEADAIAESDGRCYRAEVSHDSHEGGYKYNAGLQDPSETALDSYENFHAKLTPATFHRVAFGRELVESYGLEAKAEIYR